MVVFGWFGFGVGLVRGSVRVFVFVSVCVSVWVSTWVSVCEVPRRAATSAQGLFLVAARRSFRSEGWARGLNQWVPRQMSFGIFEGKGREDSRVEILVKVLSKGPRL